MAELLRGRQVVVHPFVTGELALGHLRDEGILVVMSELTQSEVAEAAEVLQFIRRHRLRNAGIGYVDVHLLAALKLMPTTRLWTRDQKLKRVAEALSLTAADLV